MWIVIFEALLALGLLVLFCGGLYYAVKQALKDDDIKPAANPDHRQKQLTYLTTALASAFGAFILSIVFMGSSLMGPLFLVMLISALAFLTQLGVLASQLGRSWIAWVGITFITKPIGPLVAYALMRRLVKRSLERTAAHGTARQVLHPGEHARL